MLPLLSSKGLAPYTLFASVTRERLDCALTTSRVRTLPEGVFVCGRPYCQLVLFFYILTILGVGGCQPAENIITRGLEDSSSERYGWWAGGRGEDGAVDIDFKGNGLQIEVLRSATCRIWLTSV